MTDSEKLQWLYDVEQIRQLKHRYCAFCDEQYDADGICSLFVEDGVWDGGPFGRHEGRDAIHRFFSEVPSQISFANHYVSNGVIEVAGSEATGRWDLWQPMVREPGSVACWLIAKYRDTFVRTREGWRFRSLEVGVRALSPYDQGFGRRRFMDAPG